MSWLSNIFTSSEVTTLRQVIAELKTDIVELKDNKRELKEINLKQHDEIKTLIATIHEKELKLVIFSNNENNSKKEPQHQDIKNNSKVHLTKGQKRILKHFEKIKGSSFEDLRISLDIPTNNLKKYLWDLTNKGIILEFEN